MTFGERLTALRKESGYSTRKSFAEKLNIPETTLRNYETNDREAGHTFLKQMSVLFNVSCDYLLGLTDEREKYSSYPLKASEYDHIQKYRFISKHSPDGAAVVDTILDKEYSIAERLTGQTGQIQNTDTEASEEFIPTRIMSYYQKLASAGKGEYLFDGVPTDLIEVIATETAAEADFVIGVNGHSMEPTYYNGEKVFVKKMSEISTGEIGIFIKGDQCYIKELGTDRLISHNADKKAYPDIPAGEDIALVGKVLGKVEAQAVLS